MDWCFNQGEEEGWTGTDHDFVDLGDKSIDCELGVENEHMVTDVRERE